jgi:sodium transport system permease protein
MNWFKIFLKEIKDISRDRRTILASLIIPVVMVPLLLGILSSELTDNKKDILPVVISGKSPQFENYLSAMKDFKYTMVSENAASEIRVTRRRDGGEIISVNGDTSTQSGVKRLQYVLVVVQGYSESMRRAYAEQSKIPLIISEPSTVEIKYSYPAEKAQSLLFLGTLIPVLLIVFAATSQLPVAADLFAGEKERGTMEPLLCTPVSRSSILFGKLSAVILTGTAGVLSLFAGLYVSSLFVKGIFPAGVFFLDISVSSIPLILVNAVLCVLFFSGAESAICVFARSSREAQTFALPIVICAAAAGSSAAMCAQDVPVWHYLIPGHSNALLMRDILYNTVGLKKTMVMMISLPVWTIAGIYGSYKLFLREKIIFRS